MKKTLLVTIDFWPNIGGVANYYFNLCKWLGKSVVVLTLKPQNYKNTKISEQEFSFKVVRKKLLLNWLWPKWIIMFWHIWRIIKQEKIGILWAGEILPTGVVVYFLNKILKLPYVVSCHGTDILQAQQIKRKKIMTQKVFQNARYIIVNSKYTASLVKNMGVNGQKIKIIYPSINNKQPIINKDIQKKFINKYNLEGKKIILSVGRLVERKGFDKVIKAMSSISKEIPEAVYLIAGKGPESEKLLALASQFPVYKNNIILLGKINDEEKWALMELCDVLVMPARKNNNDVEGFGIVYLEANLMGKPVIAGNVGGVKEAVINNETGLLVNPESIEEISKAIIKLLTNQTLANKLGRLGRQRVTKEFAWNETGQKMKMILKI